MKGVNKFQVLTVVVVCMFLFVIAAIYSNTKDATVTKAQKSSSLSTDYKNKNEVVQSNKNTEDLQRQIDFVNQRIDELVERAETTSGKDCKIIGVYTSDGILRMSKKEAIDDARTSGADIVLRCDI